MHLPLGAKILLPTMTEKKGKKPTPHAHFCMNFTLYCFDRLKSSMRLDMSVAGRSVATTVEHTTSWCTLVVTRVCACEKSAYMLKYPHVKGCIVPYELKHTHPCLTMAACNTMRSVLEGNLVLEKNDTGTKEVQWKGNGVLVWAMKSQGYLITPPWPERLQLNKITKGNKDIS